MTKEFLPYEKVRNNALKMAYKIYTDGFIPDIIYASLRGGAYLANVISEYFKIVRKDHRPVLYAAVVARSYSDVRHQQRIMVDGWTYSPDYMRHGDKILLIDDIFDSGKTVNHLVEILIDKGIPRKDIKVAVHDYKFFPNKERQLPIQPDYWCRKHIINKKEEDIWVHYMSHELIGLSEKELQENYYNSDPELIPILSILNEVK